MEQSPINAGCCSAGVEKKAADDAHDRAAHKSGEDEKMDVKAG